MVMLCRSVIHDGSGSSQEAAQPVYLLAWIPESLLNEKGQSEWDKSVKIEEHAVQDDEEEGAFNYTRHFSDSD